MRVFLFTVIWLFASVLPPIASADATSGVNEGLDKADRTMDDADRTMRNAEETVDRSKNLMDRIKGWFKTEEQNARPNALTREVQQRLSELGYEPGPADGVAGPKTRDAIRRFQQDNGLPVDTRITPELAQLLRSFNVTASTNPAPQPQPAAERSEAEILAALEYSAGADVHQLRCSGHRDPRYRREFLGVLPPGETSRYSEVYDDVFARQSQTVTDCQAPVAEWLAGQHREKVAALNPGAVADPTDAQIADDSSSPAPSEEPSAETELFLGDGPPLSNPEAAQGGLVDDPPPAAVEVNSAATPLQPELVGRWAWVHPQKGIIAFLEFMENSDFIMENADQGTIQGRAHTENGMLILSGGNATKLEEFSYQLWNPNEVLLSADGEQTKLLRNNIQ